MKKENRKITVFLVIDIQLFILFILMLFFNPELLKTIGIPIIGFLVTNGFVYITGNVTYAWQKSAFFIPQINKEKEEKNESNS